MKVTLTEWKDEIGNIMMMLKFYVTEQKYINVTLVEDSPLLNRIPAYEKNIVKLRILAQSLLEATEEK